MNLFTSVSQHNCNYTAMIIFTVAVAGLLSPSPFAVSSGLVLGVLTLSISILSFAQWFNLERPIVQCLYCSAVSLLILVFSATLLLFAIAASINEYYHIVGTVIFVLSCITFVTFGLLCMFSTYKCWVICTSGSSAANNVE